MLQNYPPLHAKDQITTTTTTTMNKNKSCSNPDPTDAGIVVPIRNSQAILHAGPMLGKLLGGLLGAVLQLAHGRGVATLLGRLAVGLDALLTVGR